MVSSSIRDGFFAGSGIPDSPLTASNARSALCQESIQSDGLIGDGSIGFPFSQQGPAIGQIIDAKVAVGLEGLNTRAARASADTVRIIFMESAVDHPP